MTQPEARELDRRLADLDRRLRAIQEALAPERESRPVAPAPAGPPVAPVPMDPSSSVAPAPAEPPPPPPAIAAPPTTAAPDPHTKLIASLRELLDAYESLLSQAAPAPQPQAPTTVAAGPFPSTHAVGSFRAALAALPDVSAVTLRGYEGEDRAVFDVQLTGARLREPNA